MQKSCTLCWWGQEKRILKSSLLDRKDTSLPYPERPRSWITGKSEDDLQVQSIHSTMKLLTAKEVERKRQTLGYKSSNKKENPYSTSATSLQYEPLLPFSCKMSLSSYSCQHSASNYMLPSLKLLFPDTSPLCWLLCKQPRHLAQLGIFQLKFTVNNLTVCGNLENIWTASLENLAGSNPQGFSLSLPSLVCRL